jgi:hypothetical protein
LDLGGLAGREGGESTELMSVTVLHISVIKLARLAERHARILPTA